MPNRNKLVREGDIVPPTPKQKQADRRKQRRTVRTVIHQFIGCQVDDLGDWYEEVDGE
jgi:hypothetical protein